MPRRGSEPCAAALPAAESDPSSFASNPASQHTVHANRQHREDTGRGNKSTQGRLITSSSDRSFASFAAKSARAAFASSANANCANTAGARSTSAIEEAQRIERGVRMAHLLAVDFRLASLQRILVLLLLHNTHAQLSNTRQTEPGQATGRSPTYLREKELQLGLQRLVLHRAKQAVSVLRQHTRTASQTE